MSYKIYTHLISTNFNGITEKIKHAQKKLFRFDKNNHAKIYSKIFHKL